MRKIESPLLEVSNLCKTEKDKTIENFNINIARGNSLAILHKNRDTAELLTELLKGEVKAKKGKIYFKGVDATGQKNHFGVVGRKMDIAKTKSVADNAVMPIVKRGLSKSMANVLVSKELKTFELEDYGEKRVALLPKKIALRAELFTAYMCSHELMVIDEPLFALNGDEKKEELSYLLNIKKNANTTFLILTENPEIAVMLADTVMVVKDNMQSVDMVGVDSRRIDKTLEKINELLNEI